jgi:hypothetical protein
LPKGIDDVLLVPVHPAGRDDEEKWKMPDHKCRICLTSMRAQRSSWSWLSFFGRAGPGLV